MTLAGIVGDGIDAHGRAVMSGVGIGRAMDWLRGLPAGPGLPLHRLAHLRCTCLGETADSVAMRPNSGIRLGGHRNTDVAGRKHPAALVSAGRGVDTAWRLGLQQVHDHRLGDCLLTIGAVEL